MKAKIILFIVEGITDKICLGYVLDQLLSNNSVQFQLTDGDITTRPENTSTNITAKLGKIIKDFSGKIYKPSDFFEVVHLVDTDGTYVSDEKVILGENEKTTYRDSVIETKNVYSIQQRNRQKSDILNRLITIHNVSRMIPYSVYFFSCNLDHVLHNNPNLTRQEKNTHAETFEKEYADKPQDFMNILSNYACPVAKEYILAWEFIKLEDHSLQKYTNFHLYFSHPRNPRQRTQLQP